MTALGIGAATEPPVEATGDLKSRIAVFINRHPPRTYSAREVSKAFRCTQGYVRKVAKERNLFLRRLPSKYRNNPREVDGIIFDSIAEARRYGELKLLERAGTITDLVLQPRYMLTVKTLIGTQKKIGTYVADFAYQRVTEREKSTAFQLVVEDTKGVETQLFRWKRKHFEAEYGIRLQVIR